MLAAKAAVAKHRVLSTRDDGVRELRTYTREKREEYLTKGWAIKNSNGQIAYPIRDVGDLRNAIRSYGRAAKADKPKVRRHIIKRARGLSRTDLIPENWMKAASVSAKMQLAHSDIDADLVESVVDMGLTAALRFRKPWDESHQPRDEFGRWRKVMFRLKSDLENKTGTKAAIDKIEEAEDAESDGDLKKARDASEEVMHMLEKLADDTTNVDDQEMLRMGSKSLSEVIARLPLPQGQVATKMRFTDLPVELRDLVEDIVDRAAAKMDQEGFQEVAGELRNYISGGDYMDSDEIQSHLNRIIRSLV